MVDELRTIVRVKADHRERETALQLADGFGDPSEALLRGVMRSKYVRHHPPHALKHVRHVECLPWSAGSSIIANYPSVISEWLDQRGNPTSKDKT